MVHKMTQSFDDIKMHDCTFKSYSNDYYAGFEAGAQSKQGEVDKLQAEIDNLQNRIDDLKSFCIKGVESNVLSIEYNQALIDMHKILKGDGNE